MQLGAQLMDCLNPKIQVFMGGLVFGLSIFSASFVTNYFLFIFVFSICSGVGYGILYMLPIKCSWAYFPNKNGLISGIIFCGGPLGAVIFT